MDSIDTCVLFAKFTNNAQRDHTQLGGLFIETVCIVSYQGSNWEDPVAITSSYIGLCCLHKDNKLFSLCT